MKETDITKDTNEAFLKRKHKEDSALANSVILKRKHRQPIVDPNKAFLTRKHSSRK